MSRPRQHSAPQRPAAAPAPSRRPRAPLFALAALVAIAACARGPDPEEAALAARFEAMTRTALQEIDAYYIEPRPSYRLTFSGLRGVADRFAPGLKIGPSNGTLYGRTADGAELASVGLPAERSPAAWAETAAAFLSAVRARSPAFGAAEEEALYDAFFDGLLRELDPYSRYAGREAARQARAEREGFGGVGAALDSHPDGARIVGVTPGRPAAGAGLVVGDVIVAIDGAPVGGLGVSRVAERLRGPVDQPVRLTVRRAGLPEPLTLTVGRTRIVPDTVRLSREGPHALIRVSSFNQRTAKRLAEALASSRHDGPGPPAGVILDLRGNPGGLLDQAIYSADLFLETGLISLADGRHPTSRQRFLAEPGDLAQGLPMVILIDGASASAAEILAAALQDQGRAALIGMSSFGKGTIQTVATLPNQGELYLTWARFVAPSGYALHRLGVGPTICTTGVRDAVRALDGALAPGAHADNPPALRRRLAPDAPEDEIADVLDTCPWRPHEGGDIDLAVARLLLDSPALYERAIEIGRFRADG